MIEPFPSLILDLDLRRLRLISSPNESSTAISAAASTDLSWFITAVISEDDLRPPVVLAESFLILNIAITLQNRGVIKKKYVDINIEIKQLF